MKELLKRKVGWNSLVSWNTGCRLDLIWETFMTLTTRTLLAHDHFSFVDVDWLLLLMSFVVFPA